MSDIADLVKVVAELGYHARAMGLDSISLGLSHADKESLRRLIASEYGLTALKLNERREADQIAGVEIRATP